MMIQKLMNSCAGFFNFCAVYYVIQLIWCTLVSLAVCPVVFLLRKTLVKNRVFLKGALWSLFIPVLFAGKMKFFYEGRIGFTLFSWWMEICKSHLWICWLYLCGMFLSAVLMFGKRRKLKKMIGNLEKRIVWGTVIYVTKMPVTPSTIGVFKPIIIMPEVMLKEYDRNEIELVLLHEKTHIRLGQLLLKSMRLLKAENEDFNMFAAFVGDKEYENICDRVTKITKYKPYRRAAAAAIFTAVMLCGIGAVVWIHSISYARCNENDTILVYQYSGKGMLFSDYDDSLEQMIYYDDSQLWHICCSEWS